MTFFYQKTFSRDKPARTHIFYTKLYGSKHQIDSLSTDFSKAFDEIDIELLIKNRLR